MRGTAHAGGSGRGDIAHEDAARMLGETAFGEPVRGR